MTQGFEFESLLQLLPALPWLFIGFLTVAIGSAMLVTSPAIFMPNVGVVKEDDYAHERRKTTFVLLLTVTTILFAVGWFSFTEVSTIMTVTSK